MAFGPRRGAPAGERRLAVEGAVRDVEAGVLEGGKLARAAECLPPVQRGERRPDQQQPDYLKGKDDRERLSRRGGVVDAPLWLPICDRLEAPVRLQTEHAERYHARHQEHRRLHLQDEAHQLVLVTAVEEEEEHRERHHRGVRRELEGGDEDSEGVAEHFPGRTIRGLLRVQEPGAQRPQQLRKRLAECVVRRTKPPQRRLGGPEVKTAVAEGEVLARKLPLDVARQLLGDQRPHLVEAKSDAPADHPRCIGILHGLEDGWSDGIQDLVRRAQQQAVVRVVQLACKRVEYAHRRSRPSTPTCQPGPKSDGATPTG